jgi:uncharacterized protein YkwD
MFYKKIFLYLMIVALIVTLLSSISFTLNEEDISGSFVVRAGISSSASSNDVVQTVANIKVEALTDSVALNVEENVDDASKEIYAAYQKAEEERKIAEEKAKQAEAARIAKEEARKAEEAKKAESKAAAGSSGGASGLSGIEAEILNLINSTRTQHGLSTLNHSQVLTDLARLRSNDMVSRNYFSHYTPDGQNIKHILNQHGVSYRNFGENLGNAKPANYGTPGAFLNAWMNSPSHRDNMLKDYYTSIGIGVVDGGGRRVVTVLFIR